VTHISAAPSTTKILPEDYVLRVTQVHESGGYGSRGYDHERTQHFLAKAIYY